MAEHRSYEFTESVSFRFLRLTSLQVAELTSKISGAECRKKKYSSYSVGVVELRKEIIGPLIEFYGHHNQAAEDCDIFLSLTTENDTEIWEAPAVVNEVLRSINCRLTFSFTCL
tara:strand:+ start:7251 stop:7592 length:342 start_codon:yes stop_codon:yes gene_type:complete